MSVIRKIYERLNKLSDIAQKIIEVILAVLVLTCAADLLLQVAYRFILVHIVSFTCTWTTEYAQDALVWITYFAVGICYKENSMASVNLIFDRLKGRSKLALYLLTRVLVAVFLYIGLRYGWESIVSVSNWKSTNLHLPGYALYGAPFFGCLVMAYELLTEILGTVCGKLQPFMGRSVEEEDLWISEKEK
ncbi:MAG: TRAP transporter small permease subunit [Eubacteriales bacterium]|nr:TRAP transporter small permease subunit [Eubacteriales bacterium]